MSYKKFIGTVIDKSNPSYADFPETLNGEIYIGGNALTGWQTRRNYTPEEKAAIDARKQRYLEQQEIKNDKQVKSLINASPQAIENYVENNVTNLATAKAVIARLAKAISAIGRDDFV